MSLYTRITSRSESAINAKIVSGFLDHYQNDDIRKTHLFAGRYENIYLTEQYIPELAMIISEATAYAEDILQTGQLRAGYWFNYMPPDSTTTLHTHDDSDELLSAVYYVDASEDSGDLIIYDDTGDKKKKISLTPRSGDFIFFRPEIRHEVARNNSDRSRLSIGINFGRPYEHCDD